MTNLEFDHLFIFTGINAPAVERLIRGGLVEGSPNVHLGQGTTNRRIFFCNAMLEFLWVHDEAEARSPRIAPTRLWERSRYRQTSYSPFGLAFRLDHERISADSDEVNPVAITKDQAPKANFPLKPGPFARLICPTTFKSM